MREKLSPVTVRAMTTATISPLVALVDVTKRFPDKAAVALDRVSATIPSGPAISRRIPSSISSRAGPWTCCAP